MELLYLPFVPLLSMPGLPFLPGIGLLVCYRLWGRYRGGTARRLVLGAAALWLVYAVYETVMYFWMKTVIAPIRIDLVFLVPVLYVAAIVGVLACLLPAGSRDRAPEA